MAPRPDINDPYSGFRRLYEQSPSKTLWFTTATSKFATKFEKGVRTTYGGIYQCILEPPSNHDDFNGSDESFESCHFANVLGDWTSFEGAEHHEFILRNLQFDLSSLRSSKSSKAKNYLYATTHTSFVSSKTVIEANPDIDDDEPMPITHARTMPDWEIIRAELPSENDFEGTVLNDDGTLQFESVFRTNQTIDTWNECDFDCCVQNNKMHDGPWWGDSHYGDVQHAYAQTRTRGFVVDEHTGDVFVSWEGFYKNCESLANKYASGPLSKMKWTIGVSRLRMEDPKCVFLDRDTDDDYFGDEARRQKLHFPRCTEPVAIAFQKSLGRQLILPYGGFLVVPAETLGGDTARRNFLMTVLENQELSKTPERVSASVWSVLEGRGIDAGIPHNDTAIQMASSMVDGSFWETDAWDGGSLRLHYHPTKKKPDHFCRTVYDEGIHCQTVTTKMTSTGVPVVCSSSTPFTEAFLSPEQTSMFCRKEDKYNDADAPGPTVPFVAGLDVQWDPNLGTPQRIFFGCGGFGGGGASRLVGSGNFGSVERSGKQLRRVLDGAFAETVLFLPRELEGTTDPRVVAAKIANARASTSVGSHSSGSSGGAGASSRSPLAIVGLLVAMAVAAALVVFHRKRRRQQHTFSSLRYSTATMPYVELQNFDGSSGLMLD